MRSAVFFPMPGMRVSRAKSLPRIAPTMSAAAMPLRIVMASFGPMPLTVISFSKSCFSSGSQEAKQRDGVLAHMSMDVQCHLAPNAGRSENVGTVIVTS